MQSTLPTKIKNLESFYSRHHPETKKSILPSKDMKLSLPTILQINPISGILEFILSIVHIETRISEWIYKWNNITGASSVLSI